MIIDYSYQIANKVSVVLLVVGSFVVLLFFLFLSFRLYIPLMRGQLPEFVFSIQL